MFALLLMSCCHFSSHFDMSFFIIAAQSDHSSDENEEFLKTVLGGAMLAQINVDMFLT